MLAASTCAENLPPARAVPSVLTMPFFPFTGWKGSFFGDLHVHGTDGIDFYTRKKVVVTRW